MLLVFVLILWNEASVHLSDSLQVASSDLQIRAVILLLDGLAATDSKPVTLRV